MPFLVHSTFRLSKMNFYFVEKSKRCRVCSTGRRVAEEGS